MSMVYRSTPPTHLVNHRGPTYVVLRRPTWSCRPVVLSSSLSFLASSRRSFSRSVVRSFGRVFLLFIPVPLRPQVLAVPSIPTSTVPGTSGWRDMQRRGWTRASRRDTHTHTDTETRPQKHHGNRQTANTGNKKVMQRSVRPRVPSVQLGHDSLQRADDMAWLGSVHKERVARRGCSQW